MTCSFATGLHLCLYACLAIEHTDLWRLSAPISFAVLYIRHQCLTHYVLSGASSTIPLTGTRCLMLLAPMKRVSQSSKLMKMSGVVSIPTKLLPTTTSISLAVEHKIGSSRNLSLFVFFITWGDLYATYCCHSDQANHSRFEHLVLRCMQRSSHRLRRLLQPL